jgi:hypothetical protein
MKNKLKGKVKTANNLTSLPAGSFTLPNSTPLAKQVETSPANDSSYYSNLANINGLYDSNLAQAKDALNQSADTSIGSQNSMSDAALRDAYISSMLSKKALADSLARQGITGGASESANIKQDTTYNNNRAAIEQARQAAIAKINAQLLSDIANVTNEVNTNRAQALQNQANENRSYNETVRMNNDTIATSKANRAATKQEIHTANINERVDAMLSKSPERIKKLATSKKVTATTRKVAQIAYAKLKQQGKV